MSAAPGTDEDKEQMETGKGDVPVQPMSPQTKRIIIIVSSAVSFLLLVVVLVILLTTLDGDDGKSKIDTTTPNSNTDVISNTVVSTTPTTKPPWEKFCSEYESKESRPGYFVIQHRQVPFALSMDRRWIEYKEGFCSENETWGGLEWAFRSTRTGEWKLRIELTTDKNEYFWAEYTSFSISSESDRYLPSANETVYGDLGDIIRCSINIFPAFSTRDNKVPSLDVDSCAQLSGWWFHDLCMFDELSLNNPKLGKRESYMTCPLNIKRNVMSTKMILIKLS